MSPAVVCSLFLPTMAVMLLNDPIATALREDVKAALTKAGWTIEAAATQMRMSASRLQKQLRGEDPLTFLGHSWVLTGFWSELATLIKTRHDALVVEGSDLAHILQVLLRFDKHMAKAGLRAERRKEKAAS